MCSVVNFLSSTRVGQRKLDAFVNVVYVGAAVFFFFNMYSFCLYFVLISNPQP